MSARALNIILGLWLFSSAFLWPHAQPQLINTWVMGVLCAVIALIALGTPGVRYLNTILAIWLFISAFALSHQHLGTVWNNALVAVAVFIFSLVATNDFPGRSRRLAHRAS